MKKFLLSGCVALAISSFQAGTASAQGTTPRGCGSSGSVGVSANMPSPTINYQRFSYEPTPLISAQAMPINSVLPIPVAGTVLESQPVITRQLPATQSYRRYSYQPTQSTQSTQSTRSNSSNVRMEKWQYSKTDPRKYR